MLYVVRFDSFGSLESEMKEVIFHVFFGLTQGPIYFIHQGISDLQKVSLEEEEKKRLSSVCARFLIYFLVF